MKNKNILYIVLVVILLMGTFGLFSSRFDLTKEKRYTLSESSTKVLKSITNPLTIEIYLDGDFPANFKQLQNETKFMLEEFRKVNSKVDFKFIDPIKTKISQDTLSAMGMEPSILPDMKDGQITQIVIFPYAVLKYKDYGSSIPLIVQQSGIDAAEQLNKSIEYLEYNLISNIKSIIQENRKNVGILINHDELGPSEFRGFMEMALENYNAGPVVPEAGDELSIADLPKLKKMDALVIAKPRKPFSDTEKVILDQYIMNGGKTLWMVDAVNAEMDTLTRSKKIMAYPIDTNLNDLLFNYGVRVHSTLVKDLQKFALLRLVTGEVSGNPQYTSLPWPYFPLGIAEQNHPITKNINPVKFEFPTAIELLDRPGIKYDVLYQSSNRTVLKTIPNYVDLKELSYPDSIGVNEKKSVNQVLAVALEGNFQSAYKSRSERNSVPNFKEQSINNKMIVISDGDIGRNKIIKGNPLPLGYDVLTNQQYGNEQFLRNALDYLLDDANLMSLRNRNIEARLLDKQRIDWEKSTWQWFNLVLPLVILAILAMLFYMIRKRKFTK